MAFGLSANSGFSASGVPLRSTAHGVEPVVSMPMPTTCSATLAGSLANAPLTLRSKPSM